MLALALAAAAPIGAYAALAASPSAPLGTAKLNRKAKSDGDGKIMSQDVYGWQVFTDRKSVV